MTKHEILISEVEWGTRAREEYGDIEELANSIKRLGLINPITIERPNLLRAGGRRLTAATLLGWTSIPCRFFDELSEIGRLEVELEENIKRKDLAWPEEVKLKARLHELKNKEAREQGEGCTVDQTAEVAGINKTALERDLRLARALESDPDLAKTLNKDSARTKARRSVETAKRQITAASINLSDQIQNGDAICLMQSLPDKSIDLILFDPPYAEGFDKKMATGEYKDGSWDNVYGEVDDTKESIYPLIKEVLIEAKRVLKDNSHMYMFFSLRPDKFAEIAYLIKEAGLKFQQQPLFWIKPSQANYEPYKRFTVNYEPFFFIYNGTTPRELNSQSNATFPFSVSPNKQHPAEKPIGLYQALVELSSNKGEVVLDPMAGSGISLVAAKSLERKVIGFELDKSWFDLIKVNLSNLDTNGGEEE